MNQGQNNPKNDEGSRERFHDRIISLVLASIWIFAALFVWQSDTGIPESMLILATVFFLMLVPAMKELVKILDRRLRKELGIDDGGDDKEPEESH